MSDRQIGFLATGVLLAALVPLSAPLTATALTVIVAVIAWLRHCPLVFMAALVCTASLGAGAAWARIEVPPEGSYGGPVTLVTDPEATTGGVRVLADIDGVRYELRAWGSAAGHLRPRLMGERVVIDATLRPLVDAPDWLRATGITGRATVRKVHGFDVGRPHTRLANSIRRTIDAGAASMGRDQRSLFTGLVYGDDRSQSALVADNFEAAGLGHLLAVSGQNVAFVLAIVGPVLRRLERRGRFALVGVVLALFATVTRFEPSVMRASFMAGVAATGSLVGAEVSGRRVLGLAIVALVLVDPLIVHAVAFQLSVAASAGILLWSARLARAIPGPRPLVESISVTATAQIAVAPLVVARFGGLPMASLPANLLAAPAAGPVMMWGLTAGLVAGWGPTNLATALHVPSRSALWWIDSVAAAAPGLRLGELGMSHLVLLYGAGWFGLRQISRPGRVGALLVVLAVLIHPAVVVATAEPVTVDLDDHSVLWRDERFAVLELDTASRPREVLRGLRRSGIGGIDVVVVQRSGFAVAELVGWISERHAVGEVWAPQASLGVGESVPASGTVLQLDGRSLVVNRVETDLRLESEP